jgi:hypothetical protein
VICEEGEIANGVSDVVIGGSNNRVVHDTVPASSANAVFGGTDNWVCSGERNVIAGGWGNSILSTGWANSISGGGANIIGTEQALCFQTDRAYITCTISGGADNWIRSSSAAIHGATISGGRLRMVEGDHDWRAGNLFEDD